MKHVLVIVLVVATVACSASSDGVVDSTAPGIEVPLLTAPPGSTGGDAALGTFVLEYDVDRNCVYSVEPDNNGEPGTGGRVVILWPAGYTAAVTGDVVTVFDEAGEAVAVTGREFQIGGGGGPVGEREHPALCDAIGVWGASSAPLP